VSLFAYDGSAPLRVADAGVVNHHYPIRIHDVSYASPRSGRVHAYLVVPPGKGPFPAVIWAHGSGGTRRDLILPATWFAARGSVQLVVDDPFERDPTLNSASDARQRGAIVQEVLDLRRSVDLLDSLPYVDTKRIAFVGLSLGARVGALLAGTERRIEAFDLQSGRGASFGPGLDELKAIRQSHAAFLIQDGLHDAVVPRAELVALARAAPAPKTIRWYDAGHPLNLAANHDQLRWLAHELGLGGPVVRGAVAGP
jgi:dienelactone hydrolase